MWWKCRKCGNEWQTTIYSRTGERHSGCPVCNHKDGIQKRTKKIVESGQSFGLAFPKASEEWLAEKNGGLTPFDIPVHSGKKYWWKCRECGHEWEATPNHRSKGTNCPKCRDRANAKKRSISVRNIDTGEVFESASEASAAYAVSIQGVLRVCRGEARQTKGTRWEFVDNNMK